jgi:hypothetical protein
VTINWHRENHRKRPPHPDPNFHVKIGVPLAVGRGKIMDVLGVFHGDPIVNSAHLPYLAGLDFEAGDYVIPGVLRGSIEINTGHGGAGPARLILVNAGVPAVEAARLIHNVPMSRDYRLGLGALLEDELRRSKLQHTIVIHIRAMHSILVAKKRPTRLHFLHNAFTTVAGYAAIPPCPPFPPKPSVVNSAGHKHGVHIVGAKKLPNLKVQHRC